MRLATKVTVLMLVLSIGPLALMGFLTYRSSRDSLEQATVSRLRSTAVLKEAEFNRWLGTAEGALRELARRPLVRVYATALASSEVKEAGFETASKLIVEDHLLPQLEEEGGFLELFLVRAGDGLVAASTDAGQQGKYATGAPFFEEGKGGTFVQTVYYSLSLEEPILSIGTPVRDEDGTVTAVLAGHMDLDELTTIMLRAGSLSGTEETYLVNSFNFFVTESIFLEETALRKTVRSEGALDCLQGNSGNGIYDNYRDVEVVGAYRWMPEQDLCILTEVDRDEAFASTIDLRNTYLLTGGIVAVVAAILGVLFSRTITRPLSALQVAVGRMRQGYLDVNLPVRSRDEVGALAREFNTMAATLARHERDLRERSAELERTNVELESFSYSVSHDLRAPLRSIDGFSRILVEEHGPQLSEEAQHYLQRVRENTLRMGALVDDLLSLSRLGRRELMMQEVRPEALVRDALRELEEEQKDRQVEISVGSLPVCRGDPTLLKQVFVNLLGNALKFTRNRESARIDIGSRRQAGRVVYFVKDNGVGFDMEYAEKVFEVFQRLHRAEEYEGTGIGLSIVQRIIHRHGGRVWVEAEVDKGATFYFTVGEGASNE